MTESSPAHFVLVIDHEGHRREYPLRNGLSMVGRASNSDVFIDHVSVSRRHAALVVHKQRVRLVDFGVRNHTFLNGQPVHQVEVAPGDEIRFGTVSGTVRRVEEEPADVLEPTAVRRLKDFLLANETSVVEASRVIRLLSDVARTLVGTLTLPEILTRIIDLVMGNIRAERAMLLLRAADGASFTPVHVRGGAGLDTATTMVSRTAIDTAVRHQAAIITLDAQIDDRFDRADSIQFNRIRSLMCAPLFAGEELIGVLYADNALAHQFSEADLELFTALANYGAVAIARARLTDQLIEERRRRERLQLYHSPAVVDRILARNAGEGMLAAQELEISVLFGDIVAFTTLAETMRPSEVAVLLNTFFSRIVEAIFDEDGTVDKFLGDAVLAVFGAPVPQPDHAARAVRAAQAMRRIVASLNAEGTFPPVRVRYAVNTGIAIAGDIGSSRRQEYTVLGDVVNIGARLKALAEPDQLVISRSTYEHIRPPIAARALGEFSVRGRTQRVEVLSVDL